MKFMTVLSLIMSIVGSLLVALVGVRLIVFNGFFD